MNDHAGWGTDGLCVWCGSDESSGDCDPREVIDALRARVAKLEEALTAFVRQVEEFERAQWDEHDWPAAFSALKEQAKDGRAALKGGSR